MVPWELAFAFVLLLQRNSESNPNDELPELIAMDFRTELKRHSKQTGWRASEENGAKTVALRIFSTQFTVATG